MLEGNKTTEIFQAMAIVGMNMGNLGLKMQSFTRLIIVERDK